MEMPPSDGGSVEPAGSASKSAWKMSLRPQSAAIHRGLGDPRSTASTKRGLYATNFSYDFTKEIKMKLLLLWYNTKFTHNR